MLEIIISLFTLSFLEILLGIDNLVILSILASRLPKASDQLLASVIGLGIALSCRIIALFGISILIHMTDPIFSLFKHPFSIKDTIMLIGGIFLIFKGLQELFHAMNQHNQDNNNQNKKQVSFLRVILEIAFLDLIFAIDSILTAVTLSEHVFVMILANIFAILIMVFSVQPITAFLNKHPHFKILGIFFMLLIGFTLMSDGLGLHIPRSYLYFTIGFSLVIQIFNSILNHKISKK